MQHECPINPSSLSRWRKRVGADRLERMLQVTIQVAMTAKLLKPAQATRVNVDTTVQEKAIASTPCWPPPDTTSASSCGR